MCRVCTHGKHLPGGGGTRSLGPEKNGCVRPDPLPLEKLYMRKCPPVVKTSKSALCSGITLFLLLAPVLFLALLLLVSEGMLLYSLKSVA